MHFRLQAEKPQSAEIAGMAEVNTEKTTHDKPGNPANHAADKAGEKNNTAGTGIVDEAGWAVSPTLKACAERCSFELVDGAIDCAVSGGADSLALLALAAHYVQQISIAKPQPSNSAQQTQERFRVTAHHVDHGVRENTQSEIELVKTVAHRLGVGFKSHRLDLKAGPNFEARARQARYEVLPTTITTGHTADDRCETMLINLMRGAGVTGLSPLRNPQRHPIIALRRSETEQIRIELGIEYFEDPTNTDPAFQRNRIRHELIGLMNDIAQRDVVEVISRQADLIGEDAELVDQLAASLQTTDAKKLQKAPKPLVRRALRKWIEQSWAIDHPPSLAAVERVMDVVYNRATSTDVSFGYRVERTNQQLRLVGPSTNS